MDSTVFNPLAGNLDIAGLSVLNLCPAPVLFAIDHVAPPLLPVASLVSDHGNGG